MQNQATAAVLSWEKIWSLFDEQEQVHAVDLFLEYIDGDPRLSEMSGRLYDKLARSMGFRPQTLAKLPRQKVAEYLRQRAPRLFDDRTWSVLYRTYFFARQPELMCTFLDELKIAHDERGAVNGEIGRLDEKLLRNALERLRQKWKPREVLRYFAILLHQHQDWSPIKPLVTELVRITSEAEIATPKETALRPPVEQAVTAAPIHEPPDEFTTLDRVLIDQVVATVAGVEGALTPDGLTDLVETVIGLNTGWHRAYFHLGLMDALVLGRTFNFDRPEFNDRRREWYLAGALSGLARQRNVERIRAILTERAEDFTRAARHGGGPGASMARTLFSTLVECGRLREAEQLLQGQIKELGLWIAKRGLHYASMFLRNNDIASAKVLLSTLRDQISNVTGGPRELHEFRQMLNRRFGQCQQAQGDFPDAREIFQGLLDGQDDASPDLLADLGLVLGGFRALSEVRVPEAPDRREAMRASLDKGKAHFLLAVEKHGIDAPNACYALAVLNYLQYMDGSDKADGEALRDSALVNVQQAITGMLRATSSSAYESMGILGQCRFMQAVLQMARLDPVDTRAAMSAWKDITQAAGNLPKADVRRLLEDAQLVDEKSAIEIAESVWRHWKKDALDILTDGIWIAKSTFLRNEILQLARDETNPRSLRWRLWAWLVPAFLKTNDITFAQDGLDDLEALSQEPEFAEQLVTWLEKRDHYDPVWSAEDVQRARFRLLRLLGRDADAFNLLRALFYQVRDRSAVEAQQILDLFEELGADAVYYKDLPSPTREQPMSKDEQAIQKRLEQGERVSILFVGGNETQAQYDEDILRELSREWPGASVNFEHTGWSSNWGREVGRLLNLASNSDAIVMMTMMRTNLGRELRAGLNNPGKPWIPCTGKGKAAVLESIRRAAIVGLNQRSRQQR